TLAQQNITLRPEGRLHMASTDAMLLALDNGITDVAVLRDRAAKKLMADKSSKYRVVGQSVDAPGFALIAHKSVPENMRGKIRQAALALNKDESTLAKEARAGL